MTGRTGFHGLPAEYQTPAGETEDWKAALGYLQALAKSARPIVMATLDPRQDELDNKYISRLAEQIGFLRVLPDLEDQPETHRFAVNWPDPDQPCGVFTVDERLFEGARLSTNDGDDYFGLQLDLGPIAVCLMDANTNMNGASEEWARRWRKTYLDLPSASEIEQKWQAEPDRGRIRAIKEELARDREDLIKLGAAVAESMSDAELEAAGERVSWNLRTSGRMSKVHHTQWRTQWLEEFAEQLREGGHLAHLTPRSTRA